MNQREESLKKWNSIVDAATAVAKCVNINQQPTEILLPLILELAKIHINQK